MLQRIQRKKAENGYQGARNTGRSTINENLEADDAKEANEDNDEPYNLLGKQSR